MPAERLARNGAACAHASVPAFVPGFSSERWAS